MALASPAGGNGSGSDAGGISVLSGNRVLIPVSIPVDLCGNAVALLGVAMAGCQGGALVLGGSPAMLAGGGNGLVAGNRIAIPVRIGVDACGNAAAILGDSSAGCAGRATIGGPVTRVAKGAVRNTAGSLPGSELASLGCLPGVANLPTLAGLGGLPLTGGLLARTPLSALTGTGGALLRAGTLTAAERSTGDPGLGGNSLVAIAVGALLAGAAALKVTGRRSRVSRPAQRRPAPGRPARRGAAA